MRKALWALLVFSLPMTSAIAYGQSPEMNVINRAAEALGGKQRILAVKTIKIQGYGQEAHQNGGGNISASPDAPQKWININGLVRIIDLEHGRMSLRQRLFMDFVYAYARNMTGATAPTQILDGDIAYNIGADGKATRAADAAVRGRRIEMLDNPVVIIRTALDPATKLSNLRTKGNLQVMDITTAKGDDLTLAVNSETHLPAWLSWVAGDTDLGDVTYRTSFVGYQIENGVRLPYGYSTTTDFRNTVTNKLYVDKNTVDGPIDNLAAPDAVKSAAAPSPRPVTVEVIPISKGVWYMKTGGGNSTLVEFADHLTMFEAYGNEANAKAIIDKSRTVVPGKPLTEVIVSHHHFDHSGGLRTAVAEGLTIITKRGNMEIFKEMATRPAKLFPDELGKNPKPIKIIPVDEKLVLEDASMEVDVYHAIANSHMADAVFAYIPSARAVAEGDLVDEGWDTVFWGNSYPDSVKYWNLQVDTDLPVHGNIHTYPEVIQLLKKQTQDAQDLCAKVDAAGLSMQGCPVINTF